MFQKTIPMMCTSLETHHINQMWILKNSKELLEHLQSPNFNHITSIKSFDFSTLYTTIPHQKLKSRLATIIQNSFIHKNGNRRYKFLVLGHEGPYFVKEHSDSNNKYTEDDIVNMLEFLVDNIFVVFALHEKLPFITFNILLNMYERRTMLKDYISLPFVVQKTIFHLFFRKGNKIYNKGGFHLWNL